MSYSYRIRGARWLRMWTAADRSSVYAAQSEAQKIADTLCDVPWTRAKSDGPAMFPLTAAKTLDENPANRDLFDAALFCAEHSDGAHRAYANAAMYLFKLPSTSGVSLKSVTVHVESDAYNALGARIAVHLLSSAELPTVCAVVRTGDAHAEGVAARRTVERDGRNYWYSNSADVTITGGTSESPAAIGELTQYLAVFVGMENYATSRNEWLEGASYIRNLIEIETDAVVTGWTDGSTHECANEGAAPEFNVTRAMAAHGRQGRSFKFAAERLSNGWQVPEATGTAPSKGGYWSSSSDHSPSNRAVEIEFPVVGAAICPALETGAYSLCVELRAGGDGNVLPALRFRALAYNGTLTSGAAALDYRTGTMDDLRPLSAYKLLSGGAARSVMLVGSAEMSTAVADTGGNGAQGKAGLLVVGGDDGVHVLGMAAGFYGTGTPFVASKIGLVPAGSDVKAAEGRADFIICRAAPRFLGDGSSFAGGTLPMDLVDCDFAAVGRTDGGFCLNGGATVPVDGEILGFAHDYTCFKGAFFVYGDLRSVNGVKCRNVARVTLGATGVRVERPAWDAAITPDRHADFRISSCPAAPRKFLVTGAFDHLAHAPSTDYGGRAILALSDASGTTVATAGVASLSAVSGVIGDEHPTFHELLTFTSTSNFGVYWQTGGTATTYDAGDLPDTNAAAGAAVAGLRAVYGDVYDGLLAPAGEEADGAGFVVEREARTFPLSTGTDATRKVWTVGASALLVPFSAPIGFRAAKVKLEWTVPASPETSNELESIETGDGVPAPRFAVWLMRGRRVEEADGLTAHELWDATACECGGWELVGTADADDESATLDLARPLADAVGTFLLTAWASQDAFDPSGEASQYGVSGWRPDITLIG